MSETATTVASSAKNLTFLKTLSMDEFKKELGVSRVSAYRSSKTGKLFLKTDNGTVVAACSEKSVVSKHLAVVSLVIGSGEGAAEFYLCHTRNESLADW